MSCRYNRKGMEQDETLSETNVLGSKLPILGMVIPPLIGNPYNEDTNPYCWVDDHPLLYGNNGSLSLDPSPFQKSMLLA